MVDSIPIKALGIDIACQNYSPLVEKVPSVKPKVKVFAELHTKTEKQIACLIQETWQPGDIILIETPKGRISHLFHGADLKKYAFGNLQKCYGWDDADGVATLRAAFKRLRILTGLMLNMQSAYFKNREAHGKKLIKYIDSSRLLNLDESDSSKRTIRQMLDTGDISVLSQLAKKALDKLYQAHTETFEKRNRSLEKTIEQFRQKANVGTIFVIGGAAHVTPKESNEEEDISTDEREMLEAKARAVQGLTTCLSKTNDNYQILYPDEVSEEQSVNLNAALEIKKQTLESTRWKVVKYVTLFFVGLISLAIFPISLACGIYKIYKSDTAVCEVLNSMYGAKVTKVIENIFPSIKRAHPELCSNKIWTIARALEALAEAG